MSFIALMPLRPPTGVGRFSWQENDKAREQLQKIQATYSDEGGGGLK